MPRRSRMYLPGYPYHLVQRGNNREVCFFHVDDYAFYLELASQLLVKYGVRLHAYVLMTNHVHLLLTPEQSDSISRLMRVLGSRYAQYINRRYGRTGTLWEGRHKSSPVDSQQYLLKCYRYIELNPVASGMVSRPDAYRWSSFGVNGWGDASAVVTFHDEYLGLGADSESRCLAYRELFRFGLSNADQLAIRQSAHYCQPLGDSRFRAQIEQKVGRDIGQARRGRPPKGLVNK